MDGLLLVLQNIYKLGRHFAKVTKPIPLEIAFHRSHNGVPCSKQNCSSKQLTG